MKVKRIRPLTIAQLKIAAEAGTLTPEDIKALADGMGMEVEVKFKKRKAKLLAVK